MRFSGWISAAVLSAGLCSGASAQISGTVTLQGNPPVMPQIKGIQDNPQCKAEHKNPVFDDSVVVGDKGELANVIVFVKEDKEGELKGPQKETPVVLDQKGCMYSPHVLAVETGQPITVKNSDAFMHNVHSLAIDNTTFNFAEPNAMEKKIEPFTAAETFQIKCDVHPWMKAVVRVFDNPFFAVTDDKGKYEIDTKGLKDGTYSVVAWQEVYKESAPQKVTIKGGKAEKDVDFTFKSKAGNAQAAPAGENLAKGLCPNCKVTQVAESK